MSRQPDEITQSTEPWAELQPYLLQAYGAAADLAGLGSPSQPSQTPGAFDYYGARYGVAPYSRPDFFAPSNSLPSSGDGGGGSNLSPVLEALLRGSTYARGAGQDVANLAQGTWSTLAGGDLLDPEANPFLSKFVDASLRPIEERFYEQTLPGLETAAQQRGAYSNERNDLLELTANRDFLNTVGDVSSGIYNNAYNQGLGATQRALSMAPMMFQLGTMPSSTDANLALQALRLPFQQTQLEQQTQWGPLLNLMSILSGSPGAAAGSTTGPAPQSGGVSGLLGGAGVGAALAGAPGLGAFAWPLILGGSLLGYFG